MADEASLVEERFGAALKAPKVHGL